MNELPDDYVIKGPGVEVYTYVHPITNDRLGPLDASMDFVGQTARWIRSHYSRYNLKLYLKEDAPPKPYKSKVSPLPLP
jgi:hypothetical protein